jgi:hypothetical protein
MCEVKFCSDYKLYNIFNCVFQTAVGSRALLRPLGSTVVTSKQEVCCFFYPLRSYRLRQKHALNESYLLCDAGELLKPVAHFALVVTARSGVLKPYERLFSF